MRTVGVMFRQGVGKIKKSAVAVRIARLQRLLILKVIS